MGVLRIFPQERWSRPVTNFLENWGVTNYPMVGSAVCPAMSFVFVIFVLTLFLHISTSSYSSMILLHYEVMHCISSPVHFPSLCSPDALFAQKNAANWPIFKFYISNVFLSKFYFPAPCSAYFQLGTGEEENSYFNWILLNIFFSGLSAIVLYPSTKTNFSASLQPTHLRQGIFGHIYTNIPIKRYFLWQNVEF